MNQKEKAEELLKTLRLSYAQTLDDKLTEIRNAIINIENSKTADTSYDAMQELRMLSHKLAGSAGTYGFADLGNTARELEVYCQALIEKKQLPLQQDKERLNEYLTSLQQRITTPEAQADVIDTPHENIKKPLNYEQQTEQQKILIIEDNSEHAMRLKIGLSAFGYQIKIVTHPNDIEATINSYKPDVILLDIDLGHGRTSGADTIAKIHQHTELCPVIVLTAHDDFAARLSAIRAQCDFFLNKPASIDTIVQAIEDLTLSKEKEPERILAIDDDADILQFIHATLENNGMIVETMDDPTIILEKIKQFSPELILIDLHLKTCNGHEIAKIIRQIAAYTIIPIVYLSAEKNPQIQDSAMNAGADDFLTKPIHPGHLVSALSSRVTRYRMLRELLIKDSLTCLNNHATTWQMLEQTLSQAQRSKSPVSFAMVDVDHFKAVNDNYGHAVGDKVLKTLSQMMKRRLRKGDIIGRLGGEEFGVILPDTEINDALKCMESVRLSFAEISQDAAGADAPITLSCGIASFPTYQSSSELVNAADEILYQAKHSGRNRCLLSDTSLSLSEKDKAKDSETNQDSSVKQQNSEIDKGKSEPGFQDAQSDLIKKAVIIDDDESICQFVSPLTEDAGFHVSQYNDPRIFLANYADDIDLILLDLNMPEIDGIEVLRFLAENQNNSAIIIISGYDQEILSAARNLAKRKGLNIIDTLNKPLNPEQLVLLISKAKQSIRKFTVKSSSNNKSISREELQYAIDHQLEVYLQPKMRLSDKSIVGAEALARWNHPEKGFIPPDYFIQFAEQNQLIDALTEVIFNKICEVINRYSTTHLTFLISGNISDGSFSDIRFPEKLSTIISNAGLSPSSFMLELTETSLSSNPDQTMDILTRLRLKGFQISIDDFGTGHSSLSRLNELPFNELKIDKSFIQNADKNTSTLAIVKNTIELAQSLGLKTVAEGVEKQEHLDMLMDYGCDLIQGYLISRPLPADEFFNWLSNYQNKIS